MELPAEVPADAPEPPKQLSDLPEELHLLILRRIPQDCWAAVCALSASWCAMYSRSPRISSSCAALAPPPPGASDARRALLPPAADWQSSAGVG